MKKSIDKLTVAELTSEIKRTLRTARRNIRAASAEVSAMEQIMGRARLCDYRQGREPHIVPLQ